MKQGHESHLDPVRGAMYIQMQAGQEELSRRVLIKPQRLVVSGWLESTFNVP